jgi:MFS family permease
MRARLTGALARVPGPVLTVYAAAFAFATYFAMYAFRKPFAAASYSGAIALGPIDIDRKGALIIGQLVGYALSKLVGVKLNSELPHPRRLLALMAVIGVAEAALLLFAVAPPGLQIAAMFLNGLPLGTVWGICFSFLEGRRTSEILGAALSCAYIVASGVVKSIGKSLLDAGVSEEWMPAACGAIFLVPFLLFAFSLSLMPAPGPADVAQRTQRAPMDTEARRHFTRRYWPGLLALVVTYLFLTAYRDFRDNFQADIWREMGQKSAAVFTATEVPIAIGVLVILSLLYLLKSNRAGLLATYAIMISGSIMVGAATILFDAGTIGPRAWMTGVGLGLYLAYVPYGCVLLDRTIAALGTVATAVFLIYVSDAVAYGGSVGVVAYKMLGQADLPYLDFFRVFSYATSVATAGLFAWSLVYFLRQAPADELTDRGG